MKNGKIIFCKEHPEYRKEITLKEYTQYRDGNSRFFRTIKYWCEICGRSLVISGHQYK